MSSFIKLKYPRLSLMYDMNFTSIQSAFLSWQNVPEPLRHSEREKQI